MVRNLHPECENYSSVYDKYDLFGQTNTVMAHCIHLKENEIKKIKENNVFIAHCPDSNVNLTSGIAKIKDLMKDKINVGLGSDISGGENINILKVMSSALKLSKIRTMSEENKALTCSEVFYLGTKGGGKFFGNVGSFEEGYEFDALVINDKNLWKYYYGTIEERMEKLIFLGCDKNIEARYICGKEI